MIYNDKTGKKVCRGCRHARTRAFAEKRRWKAEMFERMVEFLERHSRYAHPTWKGDQWKRDALDLLEELKHGDPQKS